MSATNIVWIKLFLSLLTEDDRFLYQLNESQQLLYIKLLLLAGVTGNQIVKRPHFICDKINYNHEEECFLKDIQRIQEVFPKLKTNETHYFFENFHELHNRIQNDKWGILTKEIAMVQTRGGSNQSKRKNKNKSIGLSNDTFLQTLKDNQAYKHIDIDLELGKMDGWLLAHAGRRKTQRFVVGWLNRIEKPLPIAEQPKKRTL